MNPLHIQVKLTSKELNLLIHKKESSSFAGSCIHSTHGERRVHSSQLWLMRFL